MTLRGNAGRLVQGVNNLSGFVTLAEGPGIEIIPNNAKNSLQFGTVTALLEFDDILANGDSTARSAKFLNNASDTIPALVVHNTLDFGNGLINPGVTLKYSPGTPDGLVLGATTGTDKKILRTDIIGANTSTAIVAKSGMTFDTGLTLTVDNLVAQNVTNSGDITVHRLLPYDLAGLTINLDTCTLSCADQDPRIYINSNLNCSNNVSISGDLILNRITSTSNQNILLSPNGTGVVAASNLVADVLSAYSANDIIISGKINAASGSIRLQATGSGQILCNKAFIVGTIGSPTNSDLVMVPNSGKFYVVGSILANNIYNETVNGSLTLAANGTGTINLNSTVVASTITTTTGSNLTLTSNGTGGIVQIAAGKTFTTDIIKSTTANGNISLKNNITFDATLTLNVDNLATKFITNSSGSINFNSPVIGSTLTLSTLTSAAATNLTINSPGGAINSNATSLNFSGAANINSVGTMTFTPTNSLTYFNSILNVTRDLSTNGNFFALTMVGTNFLTDIQNGNVNISSNGTGRINLNSPVVGSTFTASTFTSAASANLTINAPGGSILTNATRIAPLGALTIAPLGMLTLSNDVQIAAGKALAVDIIKSTTPGSIAIKNDISFDAGLALGVDIIKSKTPGPISIKSTMTFDTDYSINVDIINTTSISGLDSTPISVNSIAYFPSGLYTGVIRNQSVENLDISTINNADIRLSPTGKVSVAVGKTLTTDILSATTTNGNLSINANGTGKLNLNSTIIDTTATNITASGALSLASNGTLNLQAFTGNSSVNISASGSGVVNMQSPLLVNTIVPYNSDNLTLAASGTNGNVNLTATGSGKVNFNSPAVGSTVTLTTLTSPAATNLAINAPGGSILTNATRLAPSGNLTIAPFGSLTFFPGAPCQFDSSVNISNNLDVTGSIIGNTISSKAASNLAINTTSGTINTNATNLTAATGISIGTTSGPLELKPFSVCNIKSNVSVDGTITAGINTANIPFIGSGLTTTATNGSLTLASTGTGTVNITNRGLRLPRGNNILNWYQERDFTGYWESTTTPSGTGTSVLATRIGRIVFITINSTSIIPNSGSIIPYFNLSLPSEFCPSTTINVNNNIDPYTIQIETVGIISITNYTINVSITPTLNISYYTNSI